MIYNYPETYGRIPKGAVALEWGYELIQSQRMASHCIDFQRAGIEYYVCPSCNTHGALTGRMDVTTFNIRTSAELAVEYGAEGYLLTDWGDGGHLNFISTSYVGIAWGAAMSWRPLENEHLDMYAAIDAHMYRDRAGKATEFTLKAGHFFLLEGEQPQDNTTLTHRFMMTGLKWRHLCKGLTRAAFDDMVTYFDNLRPLVDQMDFATEEGELIKREFTLSLDACCLLQNVGLFYVGVPTDDAALRREALLALKAGIPAIVERTEDLWMIRNRRSYLAESVEPWKELLADVEKELAMA
jgi:hypothetical protein